MFIPDKMIESLVGRILQVGWLVGRVKVVVDHVSGAQRVCSFALVFMFSSNV